MSADHPHDLPQTDSQPWLWWGRDKDKDKDAGKADDKAQDKPQADLSAQVTLQSIREKFGVEITPRERGYEYSYRAGGKDNVVATSTTDQSGLAQTDKALQKQVDDRLQTLSDRYKVSFGRTGDPATVEYFYKEDCSWGTGRILRAVTPTFKQLHGIEEGLKVSEPSQLDDTGKAGLKISFLDGQIMPSPYGGRPVLGLYTNNGKSGPQFFMTSAARDLPATAQDVAKTGERSIEWGVVHEITHNSQKNLWLQKGDRLDWLKRLNYVNSLTDDPPYKMVFSAIGKDGAYYTNGADSCHQPTVWYRSDAQGKPVDANDKRVDKIADAPHLTNDEMQERAKTRPITNYLMNDQEMLAEGLTAYRINRKGRADLLRESPDLYSVVKDYDNQELERFYGKNSDGSSMMMRDLSGRVVPRTEAIARELEEFEKAGR